MALMPSFKRKHARRLPSSRQIGCAALVAAYVLAAVGIPSRRHAGRVAGMACGCSADLKAAGQCCCHKRAAKACCGASGKASFPPVGAKGCCRGSDAPMVPKHRQGSKRLAIGVCPCGDSPSGMLINAAPRVLVMKPRAPDNNLCRSLWRAVVRFAPRLGLIPETPPPEARVC